MVLHRPELINAQWPFHALKYPATRAAFDTELFALLRDWSYEVITICLDKQAFAKAGFSLTVPEEQFQNALTSREVKPKTKAMNISGLQIADLIAHPSRNEIVSEQGTVNISLGYFTNRIVVLLADKYAQVSDGTCGKVSVP